MWLYPIAMLCILHVSGTAVNLSVFGLLSNLLEKWKVCRKWTHPSDISFSKFCLWALKKSFEEFTTAVSVLTKVFTFCFTLPAQASQGPFPAWHKRNSVWLGCHIGRHNWKLFCFCTGKGPGLWIVLFYILVHFYVWWHPQ